MRLSECLAAFAFSFFLLAGIASAYYELPAAYGASPVAIVGDSPISMVGVDSPITTIGGTPVIRQPVQEVDTRTTLDALAVYDTNVHIIPVEMQSVLGDENILLHVKMNDGRTVMVGLETNNGLIEQGAILGVVDSNYERVLENNPSLSIGGEQVSYSVAAYTDESTISRIMSSENPRGTALAEWGSGIRYKGLNFFSSIKFFFLNIVLSLVDSFIPPTFSVAADQEFCPKIEPVLPEKCFMGEETTSYGYSLSGRYAGICDQMASGPGGYAGMTWCTHRWSFCVDYKTDFDEKKCTCPCTVTVKDVNIGLSVSQSLPSWNPAANNATSSQVSSWNSFISSLISHENQHAKICEDGKATIKAEIDSASATAEDKDCTEACKKAEQKARSEAESRGRSGVSKIRAENDAFDSSTDHGRNQGAYLDCSIT